MHEYRWSSGLVPLVLNFAPPMDVTVNFTPQQLYLCEKKLSAPLTQEAEWAQGRYGLFEEE